MTRKEKSGKILLKWETGIPNVRLGKKEMFWCACKTPNVFEKVFFIPLEYANKLIMPLADYQDIIPDGVSPVEGDEYNYYWTGWFYCQNPENETQYIYSEGEGKILAWIRLPTDF